MCAVPLEGSVQNLQPTGTLRSWQPPSAAGPLEGLLQHHHLNVVTLRYNPGHSAATLCLKNLFSPCFCCVPSSFQCRWRKAPPRQKGAVQPLYAPPGRCMARRDGRGCSKPNLCAEANIWGESSLALANTFKYFRIADNELSG